MHTIDHVPEPRDVLLEALPSSGFELRSAEMKAGIQYARTCEPISEVQFDAFMEGIRGQISGGQRSGNRIWAVVSLTAAALVLSFATFLIVSGEHPSATATVVEEASSDIEGASVTWQSNKDGDVMVWVEVADGDVL